MAFHRYALQKIAPCGNITHMKLANHTAHIALITTAVIALHLTPSTYAETSPPQADIHTVAQFIGQEVLFTGLVENVHQIPSGTTFMDFGGRHPNAAFTCVAMASNVNQVGDLFQYNGKKVQVRGVVGEYNGKPQIKLLSPDQIREVPEQ